MFSFIRKLFGFETKVKSEILTDYVDTKNFKVVDLIPDPGFSVAVTSVKINGDDVKTSKKKSTKKATTSTKKTTKKKSVSKNPKPKS